MLSAHYRTPLNYSAEILQQEQNSLDRLYSAADNLKKENMAKPVHSSTTDEITAIFTIVRSFMAFVVYRLSAKIIISPNKTKYT